MLTLMPVAPRSICSSRKTFGWARFYFKGGIIMINHPQLLNATNSGSLMVRVETTMPVATVPSG